jgi:expansin (peptidoglycan-binding protein)
MIRPCARWLGVAFLALSFSGCGGDDGDASGGGGGGSSAPSIALGEERTGEGTYYDADGSGACSFDPSPNALDVAALNSVDWAGSAYCGACADVTGPNGSVRIRIVDLCPECKTGDLDLSPQAFEKIAPLEQGRVPITWQLVSCDVPSHMRYRYKDGSNQWWTAVQVLDHRVPVASVEWSSDGETFQEMERMDYNYFLAENGFGTDAVTLRLTAMTGQTVTDELPPVQELLIVEGTSQFE